MDGNSKLNLNYFSGECITLAKRKSKKIVDPFAEREAAKYDNPIPSREFILEWLNQHGAPARFQEIIEALKLQTEEEGIGLKRRLRAMERDGQLIYTRRGGYAIPDKMELIHGTVIGHRDGFGFVKPEDGSDDLFLTARQMRKVFDGDRVLVRVSEIDSRGRREASLVQVVEHRTHQLVGRYQVQEGIGIVVPDNQRITQDILIPEEYADGVQPDQIVMVEILQHPDGHHRPVGKVVEVLGDHMAPGMEIEIAVRAHGLPHIWPALVEKEVASISPEVPEEVKKDRVDLRHLPLVTIDGEDAKDFDDAVYAESRDKGGWRLFVAIADVSFYVQPGSALDEEAAIRGNSVYFPGQVIPMLPEILSNGLCSLRPSEDRLCMVCEMNISPEGEMTHYQFYQAVMHSQARLTYKQVAGILIEKDAELRRRYKTLVPHLKSLFDLYKTLRKQRVERGAIDFETTETRVVFGKDRKIEQIVPLVRNEAHRLIEECMLIANVAAAKFIAKSKLPTLYRIHEAPPQQKLLDLRKFLKELNLQLGGGDDPEPKDYAEFLQSITHRVDSHLIQTVLLRSLSQAVYGPENDGHFGLAYSLYTHFTSPIRRYPDLLVHRLIRHILQEKKAKEYPYSEERMHSYGEHLSMTERRADEASRDALDWLKCEYMLDRVGDEFDGIITAVTNFGIFVELSNIYIEGLVHITSLKNDYYRFDSVHHRLIGERTNSMYRLGDKIKVRVVRVDLDAKKIDFDLGAAAEAAAAAAKSAKKQKKPTKKSKSAEPAKSNSPAKSKNSRRRKPKKKS